MAKTTCKTIKTQIYRYKTILIHIERYKNMCLCVTVSQPDVTRSDRLIGNVSVTYVTLVPWRRERRRHVPSPRLLYHRWAAGSPARLLSENLNMRCTCCLLILTLWSAAAGCNNRMPMCIGSFRYTRSGLVSLSEIPIRRSPDVTSLFPPSGNEGYISNRDHTQNLYCMDGHLLKLKCKYSNILRYWFLTFMSCKL